MLQASPSRSGYKSHIATLEGHGTTIVYTMGKVPVVCSKFLAIVCDIVQGYLLLVHLCTVYVCLWQFW